jgi:hypothetical protein
VASPREQKRCTDPNLDPFFSRRVRRNLCDREAS